MPSLQCERVGVVIGGGGPAGSATLARRLGSSRNPIDGLVGIAAFLTEGRGGQPRDTRTLIEAAEDG